MKNILTLLILLTLLPAKTQAQDIPYDFVTFDTVRQYVKEHPHQYSTWLRVYIYKVKSGAGITHPRKGEIYNAKTEEQKLANMLSFYAEVRRDKGQTLHTVTDKFIVFNFHNNDIKPQPPIIQRKYQRSR